jgi:hypothetical protein
VEAHPPVADLVAEALDHDRAVVGHHPGGRGLLVEVGHDVGRRERIERVHACGAARWACSAGSDTDLAHELADATAELERATRAVAVPERHLAGLAGRGGDDHPLEGDVLDPPGGRPEQEGLAGADS